MRINDLRKSSNKKNLNKLAVGEFFIYYDELYINLDRCNPNNFDAYNLTRNGFAELWETTQVTPVEVEIKIIK